MKTRRSSALLLAALLSASAAASSELVWIHAEANEGGASGGHAALRIGDAVYHFQTVEGRTQLSRWSWARFRRLYNDLQNRTLHLVWHEVSEGAARSVRQRLDADYREQRRQLARADDLDFQRRLVASWLGDAPHGVPIHGLGLFAEARGVDVPSSLRSAVEAAHGARFLSDAVTALETALAEATLRPEDIELDPAQTWRDAAGEASAWRERIELREALRMLTSGRPVAPERQLATGPADTTAAERAWLRQQLRALQGRIAELVASARPDRGRALLLAIARHRTLARSLAEDRIFTLDPFPRNAPAIAAPRRPARRRVFEALRERLAAEHRAFLSDLTTRRALREPDYRALELIAAAHFELQRGLESGLPIRSLQRIDAPARSGQAAVAAPEALAPEAVEALLRGAQRAEARYERFLDRLHGYHLLRRNCATQLLRAAQASFASPQAAAQALGGRVEPEAGSHFVPFVWREAIASGFDLTRRSTLPAYRSRALAGMREREASPWVSARESNTLTSQLYAGSPADSHFLFFTDQRPALRPLLGALNLVYGFAQSGLGLASAVWDGGERLERGLWGAVFSLPELAFVSLRKGSFEDVAPVARCGAGLADPPGDARRSRLAAGC